jgi:hypothetical protein
MAELLDEASQLCRILGQSIVIGQGQRFPQAARGVIGFCNLQWLMAIGQFAINRGTI